MSSIKKNPESILRRPRITEKSATTSSYSNTVVFEVHPDANKQEIRHAVEKIFEVKVTSVNTINSQGKIKRVGKSVGRQQAWKKAYVTLAEGSSLDLIEGI